MHWGTTTYAPPEGGHLFAPPPEYGPGHWSEPCTACGEGQWTHILVESHRQLEPAELPQAVYAVEASDDRAKSFASNGMRWTDPEGAKRWASGLAGRWFGATDIRVVRVTPPSEDRPWPGYEVIEVIEDTLTH